MLSEEHCVFLLQPNIIDKINDIFITNNFTDIRIIMPQADYQKGKIVFLVSDKLKRESNQICKFLHKLKQSIKYTSIDIFIEENLGKVFKPEILKTICFFYIK